MKPTFLKVGIPKNTVRPPTSIRPPTASGNPASPLTDIRCNTENPATTTHDWLIPSSRVAGDLIFVFISIDGSPGTITPPAGYTEEVSGVHTENRLYWKVSDGTESDTTWTSGSSRTSVTVSGVVPGNGQTLGSPSIDENSNTPSTTEIDPPAVTPSGGAGTYHSIVVVEYNRGGPDPDDEGAVSTGYEFVTRCEVPSSLEPKIYVEKKDSVAVTTSEDPGVLSWDASGTSRIYTIWTILVPVGAGTDPEVVGYPVQAGDIDTEAATDGQVLTSDGAGNAAWEDVSGVSDHGALTGLADDDHTQYVLADGTRAFTGTVSGITPTVDAHLATKGYVDTSTQTVLHGAEPQSDGSLRFRYGVDASGRPTYTAAGTTDTEAIVILDAYGRAVAREVSL